MLKHWNILSRIPESAGWPPPARGRTRAHLQEEHREARGRLLPDPGRRTGGRRGGAAVSDRRRSQDPRRKHPARDLPISAAATSRERARASFTAARTRSCSIPTSSGETTSFSMRTERSSWRAVHDGHDHPAARRPLDRAPPQLLLETLEPVAHLLRLPHQVLEVRHPLSSTGSGNSGSPASSSAVTSLRGTSTGGAGCTLTSIDPSKVRNISRTAALRAPCARGRRPRDYAVRLRAFFFRGNRQPHRHGTTGRFLEGAEERLPLVLLLQPVEHHLVVAGDDEFPLRSSPCIWRGGRAGPSFSSPRGCAARVPKSVSPRRRFAFHGSRLRPPGPRRFGGHVGRFRGCRAAAEGGGGLRENVAAGATEDFFTAASAFAAPPLRGQVEAPRRRATPGVREAQQEQLEPEVAEFGRQHVPLGPEGHVEEEHPLLRGRCAVSSRIRSRDAGSGEKENLLAVKERTAGVAQDVIRERNRYLRSAPRESREANRPFSAAPAPSRTAAETRSIRRLDPTSPSIPSTSAAVTMPPPETAACSKRDCPSRIDPKALPRHEGDGRLLAEIPSRGAISDSRPRTSASVSHAEIEPLPPRRGSCRDLVGLRGGEMTPRGGAVPRASSSRPLKACFDSM